MLPLLIDTHCHLDDEKYALDRESVISRAKAAGVDKFITIGCDVATSEAALSTAEAYPDVYFTVGIHPHEAAKASEGWKEHLEKMALHPKCVAIGECGLDYYYEHSPRNIQQEIFKQQIQLAQRLHKPIVIHVREAYEDCLALLQETKAHSQSIVIHCFTGNLQEAQALLAFGCYLSLSGVVTFKKAEALQEAARHIPLERLLIETDAPYLAPIPYRGKRNEPAWVKEVAQTLASLRGIEYAQLAQATYHNSRKIFGI